MTSQATERNATDNATTSGFLLLRRPHRAPQQDNGQPLKLASQATITKAVRALHKNGESALQYLQQQGLTSSTIKHFQIGLRFSQPHASNTGWNNVLYVPLMHADGRAYARFTTLGIPGLSAGPESRPKRTPGQPHIYWATPAQGRLDVLIVEDHCDAWRVYQEIQGTPLQKTLAVITSSHDSDTLGEWKHPDFWQRWRHVYAGQNAGETGNERAEQLRQAARREIRRATPGAATSWADYLQAGGNAENLMAVLAEAPVLSEPVPELLAPGVPLGNETPGKYSVVPVDINGAWVGGHLYYPYRVLEVIHSESGQPLSRYRTEVLRSDGHAYSYDHLPAPAGTPAADRVLALDDGTVITRAPRVIEGRQSWSHQSIVSFQQALRQKRSPQRWPADVILQRMEQHLKNQIILPYEEDYALLAFTAAVSYCQRIFDAVPLILVTGTSGSGKSEVGRALSRIGANGLIITGQTSAATAAREVDRTAGLVVFDDLEAIGQRSRKTRGGDYSELIQQLKVSYKQSTSRKSLTLMTSGGASTETLDFYGVKIITNTSGTNDILGNRMLIIRTRRADPDDIESRLPGTADDESDLAELRDEMHTWTMLNARAIHEHYRTAYAVTATRYDEIAAPLRTLADLVNHPRMKKHLAAALSMQTSRQDEINSYEDLLREALRQLIRQGNTNEVSLAQLELHMTSMVGPSWGVENTAEIPRYRQAKWIGETLRNDHLVNDNSGASTRKRLWGSQTRIYQPASQFVAETLGKLTEAGLDRPTPIRNPLSFCIDTTCSECPYQQHCNYKNIRLQRTENLIK